MICMNYRFLFKVLLLLTVVALFMITAWNSAGYFHADEYFQIIAFSQTKTTGIDNANLPWEYFEQMRPSLQPWIFAGLHELVSDFGHAFVGKVSRILSALLFLTAMFFSQKRTKWKNLNILFILLLLWFVPMLSVRFSSENWSGIFLLFGFLLFPEANRNSSFYSIVLSGFILGLAIVFRFQVVVAVAVFLALKCIEFRTIKFVGAVFVGIALSQVLAMISDFYFYGNWVWSSWNYLRVNLFEGAANDRFGVSPFYYYFVELGHGLIIVPTLLLFVAIYLKLRKQLNAPIPWMIIAFILAHSLIGHKELRFLFPIIPIAIVLMVDALSYNMKLKKAFYTATFLLLPITIYKAFQPMKAEVKLLELTEGEDVIKVGYSNENPINPFGLPFDYYRIEKFQMVDLQSNPARLDDLDYIFGDRRQLLKDFDRDQFEIVYQKYPEWLLQNFNIGGWASRSSTPGIYKVKHTTGGITQ